MNAFHKFLAEMAHKNTAVVPNGLTEELTESVKRAEARAGCYGSGEPSADDGIEEVSCGNGKVPEPTGALTISTDSGSDERTGPKHIAAPPAGIHISGRGVDVLILARSLNLLSRMLGHLDVCDYAPRASKRLAAELKKHVQEIQGYAITHGLVPELVDAQLSLLSVSGEAAQT